MNGLIDELLQKTRESLLSRITTLSYETFNRKQDAKWSIAQICHHLVLVELSSVKVVKWGLKSGEERSSDQKDFQILLDRSKRVKAPDVVQPAQQEFEVEEMITMLNNARQELIDTMEKIEDLSLLREKVVKHPALGQLSLEQWIEYLPYHEQRHMKQIEEILEELKSDY